MQEMSENFVTLVDIAGCRANGGLGETRMRRTALGLFRVSAIQTNLQLSVTREGALGGGAFRSPR